MITAGQLRASRALLGIDQRKLAEAAGLSLPTIQRMEASDGVIRGNVDSLMKLVAALDALGIELISDNAASQGGGRGVRLKRAAVVTLTIVLACAALLLALAPLAVAIGRSRRGHAHRLWRQHDRHGDFACRRGGPSSRRRAAVEPSRCRSACRGSARISASTRCRPSSSSWSISARWARACSRSATASTRPRRSACCRSIRPSSPA